MPFSPHLNSIKISNFRSIVDPMEVPLQQKMTFLVGQNNSGKTSILRFLGLLLNNAGPSSEDNSTLTEQAPSVEFVFSSSAIMNFAKDYANLARIIGNLSSSELAIRRPLSSKAPLSWSESLLQIVPQSYFSSSEFLSDFGSSSSAEANLNAFVTRFFQTIELPRTVIVPSQRMILNTGQSIPQFGQVEFPGEKIHLNTIVDDLARLDRPFGTPIQRTEAKAKLSNIGKFIAHCLEVEHVSLTVPDGRQTIYADIDGNEQPISNLGSGIEQLIVIGMGSFAFSGFVVLIDEPEIHFHPRTQKRMMQFLHRNSDAKFFVATHSAAILDSVESDIILVQQSKLRSVGTTVIGTKDRYEAVRNLGHSPSELVLANFIVWVEGPSDRIYVNHFIRSLDSSLVEGVDYAIVFYGGSVLAKHEFEESDRDFVKALSVARNFAVYMDSDRRSASTALKARVERISREASSSGGLVWISSGREIENYIPESALEKIEGFECNNASQFGRVVNSAKFDKVKFAEQAIGLWGDEWPYDLKEKTEELVRRIQQAR
jgi:predicted ATPase